MRAVMTVGAILFVCFDLTGSNGTASARPSNTQDSQKKGAVTSGSHETRDTNAIDVVARGVSVVPGAIVCPDFATLKLMFSLFTESWSQNAASKMTNGLSAAIDGPPPSPPDFARHGCTLIGTGAPMKLYSRRSAWSLVTATLPSGKTIRGVTLPSMTDYPPNVRKKQQDQEQAYRRAYDEIMRDEIERHTAAIKAENERHVAAMRRLSPRYVDESSESSVVCVVEDCQQEMRKHSAVLRQENDLFLSRSEEAARQASRSVRPPSK